MVAAARYDAKNTRHVVRSAACRNSGICSLPSCESAAPCAGAAVALLSAPNRFKGAPVPICRGWATGPRFSMSRNVHVIPRSVHREHGFEPEHLTFEAVHALHEALNASEKRIASLTELGAAEDIALNGL